MCFGQSILVRMGAKALAGAMGADPLTQAAISRGVGWVTAHLTFDHHSQAVAEYLDTGHDVVFNITDVGHDVVSNITDVGHDMADNVTEHLHDLNHEDVEHLKLDAEFMGIGGVGLMTDNEILEKWGGKMVSGAAKDIYNTLTNS